MPWCLGMVLNVKEQNVPGFFWQCHKRILEWQKKGKAASYIVKAGCVNTIVIHVSRISRFRLMIIIFIMCSIPSSSFIALSWPWQRKQSRRLKMPLSGWLSSVLVAPSFRLALYKFLPVPDNGLGQIRDFDSSRPPSPFPH